jgi:3-oxoacyl-[acyl-carrier protein] reductase
VSEVRFDFSGRRVIVTGGSRGIGRGIALAFLEAGASVSICGRSARALAQAAESLAPHGPLHSARCDLADADAIPLYVAEAAEALGGLDILVNNASGFGRADDEAGWNAAIGVDLMGTIRMCRAAEPLLAASGSAAIVHLASITAFRASRTAPAYAAIKAALVNYTASQALALLPLGIRVNAVAPGSTEAPGHFFEKRRLAGDPGYAAMLASQPSGRMGTPADIAGAVLFLASDAGRWVVGQTIVVDGGQGINGG